MKNILVIVCLIKVNIIDLSPVVHKMDSAIDQIDSYTVKTNAIHLLNNSSLLFINNTKTSMLLWSCISTFWLSSTWAQNDDNIRNIDRNFRWLFSITISVQ